MACRLLARQRNVERARRRKLAKRQRSGGETMYINKKWFITRYARHGALFTRTRTRTYRCAQQHSARNAANISGIMARQQQQAYLQ